MLALGFTEQVFKLGVMIMMSSQSANKTNRANPPLLVEENF